ncbi:hypothetical protein Dsin_021232 [Dipteronia sinensis]|uniref:Protein kinase domain-containing protein n=1 Tax=Dipteronia sinensis TaxID=43782 RepID=A0AAE0E008_9ROSI|nr:hypothetical protein Dsin_021232 [Dipteronia sinensis]
MVAGGNKLSPTHSIHLAHNVGPSNVIQINAPLTMDLPPQMPIQPVSVIRIGVIPPTTLLLGLALVMFLFRGHGNSCKQWKFCSKNTPQMIGVSARWLQAPIIHRDVKSSNILLNDKLQAKIADFGLSQIFQVESGTHISTVVACTPGYLDPMYGISEASLIRNYQTISKKKSAWKAVELALSCTSQSSSERPTMIEVVMELKECLALAMTPNGEGRPGNKSKGPRRMVTVDVNADEFSPSPR